MLGLNTYTLGPKFGWPGGVSGAASTRAAACAAGAAASAGAVAPKADVAAARMNAAATPIGPCQGRLGRQWRCVPERRWGIAGIADQPPRVRAAVSRGGGPPPDRGEIRGRASVLRLVRSAGWGAARTPPPRRRPGPCLC